MADIGNILSGAAGGLAVGGPWGAALGGLSGLFGGGDKQTQTTEQLLRALTGGEKQIISQIEKMMPGVLSTLDPAARQKLVAEFQKVLQTQGATEIEKAFKERQSKMDLDFARTGGVTGSLSLYSKGELAQQKGEALSNNAFSSLLGAEQLAGSRAQESLSSAGSLANILSSIYGSQTYGAGQRTVTTGGANDFNNLAFSALGYGLINPKSYFNQKIAG